MQYLIRVPYALFFVGVGGPDFSDLGRQLADFLLVYSVDMTLLAPSTSMVTPSPGCISTGWL